MGCAGGAGACRRRTQKANAGTPRHRLARVSFKHTSSQRVETCKRGRGVSGKAGANASVGAARSKGCWCWGARGRMLLACWKSSDDSSVMATALPKLGSAAMSKRSPPADAGRAGGAGSSADRPKRRRPPRPRGGGKGGQAESEGACCAGTAGGEEDDGEGTVRDHRPATRQSRETGA